MRGNRPGLYGAPTRFRRGAADFPSQRTRDEDSHAGDNRDDNRETRDSEWTYAPIPVVGPLVGGALAGLVVRLAGI